MRRPTLALALTAGALLAGPAAALAADQTVQAVDGTPPDGPNLWSPKDVTVRAGETVTWSFTGTTVLHNVASASPNWSFRSEYGTSQPPASFSFATPGTYAFVCEVHPDTMKGTVTVTDAGGNPPPPPPPPPLSEQPFPNDAPAPSAFEVHDTLAPRLTRVRAQRRRHGVRVRFRLDEPAIVRVRVERGGRTIKRRKGMFLRGRDSLYVHILRPGRYRVRVVARDLAGNLSRTRSARVRIG